MRFEFVPCASLPRLAWCAQLRRGSDVARIYHGPWVETRESWFVEGAWTGDFERGELDGANFNLGTGGVLRAGRAVFCTQSDTIERLYSVRAGAELYLSNSLVFLLAMTGDEPDPGFPFYYHALRAHAMDGIRRTHKTIRMRRRRVALHDHCQLAIGPDLRVERIEKPAFPQPQSFRGYVALLEDVMASVLTNAASPLRRNRRYAGLATVSSGYDSNALAALLVRLGVREAITFAEGESRNDSGAEVAQRLGMRVKEFDRLAFLGLRGAPETEFFAGPRGFDVVLAPCEDELVGKVLVIGRNGDVALGLDPARRLASFRMLRDHVPSGSTLLEFRLRVGFLNFNPLFTAGLHLSALEAISRAEEMRPWRLGGSYDRPIARRILEEAGVPRGLFGVRKARSAAIYLKTPEAMSPGGRSDFESYRRSMPRPAWWRRPWQWSLVKLRTRARRLGISERLIAVPRQYDRVNEMDFALHWGHARLRPRYAEAVAVRDQGAPRPVTV